MNGVKAGALVANLDAHDLGIGPDCHLEWSLAVASVTHGVTDHLADQQLRVLEAFGADQMQGAVEGRQRLAGGTSRARPAGKFKRE